MLSKNGWKIQYPVRNARSSVGSLFGYLLSFRRWAHHGIKEFLVPGGVKKWEAHLWSRTAVHLSGPYEAFVYVSDLVEKWGGTELLCFENLRQHSG